MDVSVYYVHCFDKRIRRRGIAGCDDEYCTVNTRVTIVFDNEGAITDVKDIYAEGLEWEGVRSSSWAECYPDYDWLKEELINELALE